jgi:hypothetical protein
LFDVARFDPNPRIPIHGINNNHTNEYRRRNGVAPEQDIQQHDDDALQGRHIPAPVHAAGQRPASVGYDHDHE